MAHSDDESCRVFFLYPDNTLRDEVTPLLVRNEYEAYAIDKHEPLSKIIDSHQSIVYANIDKGLSEEDWRAFIADLTQRHSAPQLRVGILSANKESVQNWKASDLELRGGCVPIQSGVTGTLLMKLLERFAAKGRRKHIRARYSDRFPITFNVKIGDSVHNGKIEDISAAGMTCRFESEIEIQPNSYLSHVMITTRDQRCTVSGTVVGTPNRDPSLQLVMFDTSVSSTDESKLYAIVQGCLQAGLEDEIAAVEQK